MRRPNVPKKLLNKEFKFFERRTLLCWRVFKVCLFTLLASLQINVNLVLQPYSFLVIPFDFNVRSILFRNFLKYFSPLNLSFQVRTSSLIFVLRISTFRQNWGLRGVLENLFRLWYNGIHPIGMKELMHPHKERLAAALAFYSLLGKFSERLLIHMSSAGIF